MGSFSIYNNDGCIIMKMDLILNSMYTFCMHKHFKGLRRWSRERTEVIQQTFMTKEQNWKFSSQHHPNTQLGHAQDLK